MNTLKAPLYPSPRLISQSYSDHFGRSVPDALERMNCTSHLPLNWLVYRVKSLQSSPSFHITSYSFSDVLLCLSLESGCSGPLGCGLTQDPHLPRLCQHLCSQSEGGSCGVTSFTWHLGSFRNWGEFFKWYLYICIYWKQHKKDSGWRIRYVEVGWESAGRNRRNPQRGRRVKTSLFTVMSIPNAFLS